MEYVYAALLLHKVQKEINEVSVKKVISATGVKADDVKVKALVSALDEVDIEEALKNATLAPAVAPAPVAAAPAEEKKAEPAEEEKKEEALEGLSSLFG